MMEEGGERGKGKGNSLHSVVCEAHAFVTEIAEV